MVKLSASSSLKLLIWIAAASQMVACSRSAPPCDSGRAEVLVHRNVHATLKSSTRDGKDTPIKVIAQATPRLPMRPTLRHQAMLDVFHPNVSADSLQAEFNTEIAKRVPASYQDFELPLALAIEDYMLIRQLIVVKLSNVEVISVQEAQQYGKSQVCRAQLHIMPRHGDQERFRPLSITYAMNAPPRRSDFYIPVDLLEATPPPLPFQLSDSEKVSLMALGATKDLQAIPRRHSPSTVVLNHALQAAVAELASLPNTPLKMRD